MMSKFVDRGLCDKMSAWAFAIAEKKILQSHLAAVEQAYGGTSEHTDISDTLNLRDLLDESFEEVLEDVYGN